MLRRIHLNIFRRITSRDGVLLVVLFFYYFRAAFNPQYLKYHNEPFLATQNSRGKFRTFFQFSILQQFFSDFLSMTIE